jgi:hypothetical protein
MSKHPYTRYYLWTVFLISSCHCHQTELTTAEKHWTDPYHPGQMIVFKSNANHFDTLTVTEKRDFYTDCNPAERGRTKFHIISLELKPKTCADSNYCLITIEIKKEKKDVAAIPFIRVFDLEYSPHIQNDQLKMTTVTLATNHKTYDLAFLFESGMSTTSYGNNYLTSFVWDKKDGLIRYSNKDEIFDLLSN